MNRELPQKLSALVMAHLNPDLKIPMNRIGQKIAESRFDSKKRSSVHTLIPIVVYNE